MLTLHTQGRRDSPASMVPPRWTGLAEGAGSQQGWIPIEMGVFPMGFLMCWVVYPPPLSSSPTGSLIPPSWISDPPKFLFPSLLSPL